MLHGIELSLFKIHWTGGILRYFPYQITALKVRIIDY